MLAPIDVGPGAYLLDNAQLKELEKFKPQKYAANKSNWAGTDRFT